MAKIALVSPKGGVGKTTITANLAAALLLAGGNGDAGVLTVDLDPQNALRLHHRMPLKDGRGLIPATLNGGLLQQACHRSPAGVDCLAYGDSSEDERLAFEKQVAGHPEWLDQTLSFSEHGLVLIDTPPGPSVYMRQALNAADIVMVVLLADAASFATLGSMSAYMHEYCGSRAQWPAVHYIANQTDWGKPLTRDVVQVLKKTLGSQTPLWQIHYDMTVEEALAHHQPVVTYNPRSVAARDFRGVAAWLRTMF